MVEVAATMPAQGQQTPPPVQPPTNDPTKKPQQAPVEAPFEISMLQDRDRWLKLLVYARHGVGKTELLCSAVDVDQMQDVLFIDAESGEETLYDSPRIHNANKIYRVRVSNFTQVARVQEFLKAYCVARDRGDKGAMTRLCARVGLQVPADNPPTFRTVIVDSLTEVEAYCQYQILKIETEVINIDAGNLEVSGWPEFRKNFEMVKLLVRAYRNLPMNVLMACAEGWTQDENKRYHYSPQMTGKLSSQVQGFFDIVGWLVTQQPTEQDPEAPRRMYIQPVSGGPRFDAKNRKSVYKGVYFENPNMTSIMRDVGLLKAEQNEQNS